MTHMIPAIKVKTVPAMAMPIDQPISHDLSSYFIAKIIMPINMQKTATNHEVR